jgi:hypothetical protein
MPKEKAMSGNREMFEELLGDRIENALENGVSKDDVIASLQNRGDRP